MKISRLSIGSSPTNCYLLSTDRAAVVIDPGVRDGRIDAFLQENENKERLIIITHAHFDHIGGAEELREKYGVDILIGEKAVVTEDINNLTSVGCVKVNGQLWSARAEDDDMEIVVGDVVEIIAVKGVKLVCRKISR